MKKHKVAVTYGVWIVLYVVAVLLSLVDHLQGAGLVLRQIYSFVVFVPGVILAAWAVKTQDKKQLRLLRWVSGASLGLTVALLVVTFLCVNASAQVGRILHSFLILVSAPMLICFNWAVSLFLWACLLMVTIPGVILPRKKK